MRKVPTLTKRLERLADSEFALAPTGSSVMIQFPCVAFAALVIVLEVIKQVVNRVTDTTANDAAEADLARQTQIPELPGMEADQIRSCCLRDCQFPVHEQPLLFQRIQRLDQDGLYERT
jgi:hypothetical protein